MMEDDWLMYFVLLLITAYCLYTIYKDDDKIEAKPGVSKTFITKLTSKIK